MDFTNLNNYAALIQLISAVNFAYIFTRFHQRVYRLIFNEKKLIEDRFTSFINDITVDKSSLQSMEPIETTKGATNEQALTELKERFEGLLAAWNEQRSKMTSTLQRVKNVKGVRSLFLFISLYCLINLFNIATCGWCKNSFWDGFTILFNLLSFIVPAILTYKILRFKWANVSEVYCYRWTSWSFIITITVSLLLAWLNFIYVGIEVMAPVMYKIAFVMSIVIPFYACLFSVVYIACYELWFGHLAGSDTEKLRKLQKELHDEKISLDASYNMFSVVPPAFG